MRNNYQIRNANLQGCDSEKSSLEILVEAREEQRIVLTIQWCCSNWPNRLIKTLEVTQHDTTQMRSVFDSTVKATRFSFPIPTAVYEYAQKHEISFKLLIHENGTSGTEDMIFPITFVNGKYIKEK